MSKTRVRFAPSPTGGLHLGGVRTALYNYLFAKKLGGDFVLRIEDTDQSRYVKGAEEYIIDSLRWCGILPDEGPHHPGEYGPYRQSERKELYKKYAEQLVATGNAYYAFDTPEEIENLREKLKAEGKLNIQYNHHTRLDMKNSLSLSEDETRALIAANFPFVIRIKIPRDEFVSFDDMIRGRMEMDTNSIDDKVLLKADGMPTYHLAVVVDDYLMKITHAFRGEEWLPSAAVHVLLWKYLGWENQMPQWAHFPLILKPDGNGKLSKRDGERLGFPVFPIGWEDPATGDFVAGFKELGFLPQAFLNLLALLGWNAGTEQEIFSLEELIEIFSIERVHSSGAKFDFEKAKWFNHEWIKHLPAEELLPQVKEFLEDKKLKVDNEEKLLKIIHLTKDRCTLISDFYKQTCYFYSIPETFEVSVFSAKWDENKEMFFEDLIKDFQTASFEDASRLENRFKELAGTKGIKAGELMLPFRVMLVGDKFGPGIFDIASLLGREETIHRIKHVSGILRDTSNPK
ncbi:glutamate--tRNA ligase [soil metagenome]